MKRKVDDLGRMVIPVDIRRELDIETDDYLEIESFKDRGQIILTKPGFKCDSCGSCEEVELFMGLSLCNSCRGKLKKML